MKRDGTKRVYSAEELKRRSEHMKRLHADPEFAKRNAERMKRMHADPDREAKRLAKFEKTILLRLLPDEG